MTRNNFFANVTTMEESAPDHLEDESTTIKTNSLPKASNRRSKRIAYTIKIDPKTRQAIKDWAVAHDVTISAVIETLAHKYLGTLKKEDIRP